MVASDLALSPAGDLRKASFYSQASRMTELYQRRVESRGSGRRVGRRRRRRWYLLLPLVWFVVAGCQSTDWVRMRRLPNTPLAEPMKLFSWSGPQPTARTRQWLRRYDLAELLDHRPGEVVAAANRIAEEHQSAENVYALSELAFLVGKRAEEEKDLSTAFEMYASSVANAYLYLLDEKFDLHRNPYDPQFRQACDLYNTSLESAMRLAQREGPLIPGTQLSIETANRSIQLSVVSRGSWNPGQIERIEFASDYEVSGLRNHYRSFGLGVPLIAVYRCDQARPEDQFYAPGMSVPATAFLRVLPEHAQTKSDKSRQICTLELYDPLLHSDLRIDHRLVPLETDLSTPLAYSLSDPMFQRTDIGTRGLLNPRDSQCLQGIYLLEPYDPRKVPVLMVHGLWSSLITWMEMFNDLHGNHEIRDSYQFWFYLYPTGQPFWLTAAQLRQDLRKAREVLDPQHASPALDRMVLVGHSMGGLVSRLQTLESRDDYWRLVSDRPVEELQADPQVRNQLREMLYFRPNASIHRVVTIATPHRGSEFSNGTTQWLARQLIRLPEAFVQSTQRLFVDNRELRHSALLNSNSIDSLSPKSPALQVMLQSPRAPWASYHNIVGILPEDEVLGRVAAKGDGIVKYESASLDDVASELIVPEDHTKIHQHPRTVLEVERILMEHLRQLRAEVMRRPRR